MASQISLSDLPPRDLIGRPLAEGDSVVAIHPDNRDKDDNPWFKATVTYVSKVDGLVSVKYANGGDARTPGFRV